MRLIKYDNFWNDPFADFDTLLTRVFGERAGSPSWIERGMENGSRGFRVDSYVDDEAYHVVAELPGIPKEAIDVKLENAVLTISGEHKTGDDANARRVAFSRSITVGDDIASDKVSAKLENGLLTIHLPKREEHKARAITVS